MHPFAIFFFRFRILLFMFVFHILFLVQDFAVCFFIFSFWFWIFLVFLFSNSFLGLGFSWYFFFYNHFLVQDFPDISFFKGNPNSQGILNWIILILHYYYSKQHKNIENSQIIEQNLVIFSLCPSLCLLRLALPSPSWQQFFSSLNVTSDHSWNI